MKRVGIPVAIVFALAFGPLWTVAAPPGSPSTAEIAKKLVALCANVKEKEVVFISGGTGNLDLLDDIAIEVEKAGGVPMVTVMNERRLRRTYEEVPAAKDALIADASLKLVNAQSASISIDFVENPGYLTGVPPERMAARSKAFVPVDEASLKHSIKSVNLGNALYPTDALAKRFGMSKDELARIFWSGVNADYAKLQSLGIAVSKAFAAGKEVRLTNPNGTDIRMRIEARPNFVSDGVISDEDIQRGGPACLVWLPAGEVYLAPVAGSAEGTVVIDRSFFQETEILGLTLTFKAGKIASMTAGSGLDKFKPFYDAAGAGKDEFSFIDVGINTNVAPPPNSKMQSFVQSGMVTVGIGGNTWAGGTNSCPFGHIGFLPGSQLEVDGKALVRSGALASEVVSASR